MADFLDGLTIQEINFILSQSDFEELPPHSVPAVYQQNQQHQEYTRFPVIEQSNIQKFIPEQENKNTKRKTNSDIKLFKLYITKQGLKREIQELSTNELDLHFSNFISVVKKTKQQGL